MKETLKYTPVPWELDWGIPLVLSCVAVGLFFWLGYGKVENWQLILRGIMAGTYTYIFFWHISSAITKHKIYAAPALINLGLFFLVVVWGHHEDKKRYARWREREGVIKEPDALWSPEPIVGYRATIHSYAGETFRFQEARCRNHWEPGFLHGEVPKWNCTCGFYAMKEMDSVSLFSTVIVLLWGRVIEHENGYRASHMMPIAYAKRMPSQAREGTMLITYVNRNGLNTYRNNLYYGFEHLPVVNGEKIDLLIKKAIEEFDPENPTRYYGGPNGYRQADTEN